jgi:hypothetical protein
MPKKPYRTPQLRRVTVLTPAIRSLLAEVKAIREGKSWVRPDRAGAGRMGTDIRHAQ